MMSQLLPPRNYKYSFKEVHLDKYGNLLVQASSIRNKKNKNNLYLDVFRNGILKGRILFDLLKVNNENIERQLYFKNDRLYIFDKENSILSAYDYTIGG